MNEMSVVPEKEALRWCGYSRSSNRPGFSNVKANGPGIIYKYECKTACLANELWTSCYAKQVTAQCTEHWVRWLAGLDARAAAIVMRAVRNIVNTGRTIVCTIHQPSIDIFESFDELLLLKRGGETIFNGQLGKNSKDLIEYFQVSFSPHLS